MQKFLILILCLFLASTLVISVSCKKKEEAPPAPLMEFAPAEEEAFEPTEEIAPAEEMEVTPTEEVPPTEEHH